MKLALALTAVALTAVVSCGSDGGDAEGSTATTTTERPASTTTEATTPPTTEPVDPALACIAELPVRQKVGQLVGVAVDGRSLGSEAGRVAGLGVGTVLLQRPATSGLAEGIAGLKAQSTIPPLVAVDEEGGEVQHLRAVLGPIPSERQVAATMDGNAAGAIMREHARGMADLGVDVVFGPVVDVGPAGGGGPLGDRVFADDPGVVEAFGRVYVDAFVEAGLLPVLKHFPGHGSGEADSHDGPVGTPPIDDLRGRDLLPYEGLLGDEVGVMVGHLNVPGLTGTTPASVSGPAISGLLRDEFGFDGVIFSDSLSMGAIAATRPPEQAGVSAIAAGADVALFVTIANPVVVIDALEAAVLDETIPTEQVDASVARILEVKQVDACTL